MKKILGISLVALFAAVPMMASADNVTLTGNVAAAEGDSGKVAAVSYVKGAYRALGLAVNSKQDQLKVGETSVSSAVVGTSGMHAASSVAQASDSALVTEQAVLTAINSAVSAADNAMGTRVTDLETAVGDSTTGLVADVNTLKTAGYITKDVNDLTNYTTTTDMNTALNSKIETSAISTSLSSTSNDNQVASAKAAYTYANSAASAALSSANAYTNEALGSYTTTSDLEETYATKDGVEKTINAVTFSGELTNTAITGTVNAMAEWGSSEVSEIAMTGSVTSGAVSVTKSTASYTTE